MIGDGGRRGGKETKLITGKGGEEGKREPGRRGGWGGGVGGGGERERERDQPTKGHSAMHTYYTRYRTFVAGTIIIKLYL